LELLVSFGATIADNNATTIEEPPSPITDNRLGTRFVGALLDRLRVAPSAIFWRCMQKLPRELDPDFYRETRLRIVRVELEQLRQDRSAFADIERRSKIPLGISRLGEAMPGRNR
jgi:hypothetical protein